MWLNDIQALGMDGRMDKVGVLTTVPQVLVNVKLIGFLRIIFERQGPEKGAFLFLVSLFGTKQRVYSGRTPNHCD